MSKMCRKDAEAREYRELSLCGSEWFVLLAIERAGIGVYVSDETLHIRITIVRG